ncbi:MAG TPA: transglutaminase domain-containing protein [Candidatus Binatus sp.]|nr:transglutaminase domain-containing protein [Candidatus Binatus sp.]
MPTKKHLIFRVVWRGVNLLLVAVMVSSVYAGVREYSVRRYLDGFSDAIVPNALPEEQKLNAILAWMRAEPSRAMSANPEALAKRDPETTLTYSQLLNVCGTATNAFLNLARSSDLRARRLLLLTADNTSKHVVAEVLIGDRWIIVDPTYRVILRDAAGHYLTRKDLQDPAVFEQAVSVIPNYPREYNYDHFAHVRLARLPYIGFGLRKLLGAVVPGWEEAVDWSLFLERESFFYLVLSVAAMLLLLLLRAVLAWYADSRLRIPRFHLREHALRAGVAFFSAPEIKQ